MNPVFWPSSAYHLLETNADGHLLVTDDFLRALLERPELAPIEESCQAERALHEQLLLEPRQNVEEAALSRLADADTAENYRVWLRFRQRILAFPTLEASYLALFKGVDVPPLLVDQLTQVLIRHILGDGANPLQARAAEMLFRTQTISVQEGAVMAADKLTVDRLAVHSGFGDIGKLLSEGGIKLRSVDLDVLNSENMERYWERSEGFDWVISLNTDQPALQALCEVLARWIAHFLGVNVSIQTEREIDDDHWVWHVGLDTQASAVLNDLYQGVAVEPARLERMLCLFRLNFLQDTDVLPQVRGKPVYLAMAMDEQHQLRLKPQNLLLNLPLSQRS